MKLILISVLYFITSSFCDISDDFIGKVFSGSWSQSQHKKYRNVIVSPFSLVAPLGVLALASHGKTHKEILHALDVKKSKQISQSYATALKELDQDVNTKIITANRVYVAHGSKIDPDFYQEAKKEFDLEVVNINFNYQEKTAELINKWVEKKTEKLIKELVSPESISPDTCVMVINTIYFEAKWAKQFRETNDREFYVNPSTRALVPFMTVELDMPFAYSKVLKSHVLMIPYRKSKCSFMIIYPNANVDIHSMRNQLKDRHLLGDVTKDMKITNVNLYMPKFEFEHRIDLKNVLQRLDINEIFTLNANLSKMVSNTDDLYVNDAHQTAFIRVNEEGTQAAAANVMAMFTKSTKSSDIFEMILNRPFYFEIGCSETQIFYGILFKP